MLTYHTIYTQLVFVLAIVFPLCVLGWGITESAVHLSRRDDHVG